MNLPLADWRMRHTSPAENITALTHQLASVRDTQEIMDIIRHGARHLTGADGVTFVLRDGNNCYYAEEDAISPLWKGKRFPIETCISGWAMLNRETTVIEDIYEDNRIPHEAYSKTFVQSLVMVPVRREDPVAAIGAYWSKRAKPTHEQIQTLEAVANAAAVALTNVGLIHSLHHVVEELRLRNKELEIANRSRSIFLSNMSHELRTPLNAIMGFAEAMKHEILGPIGNEEYISYANDISVSGGNLLQLINNILDMAAIGSGSKILEPEPVNLRNIIVNVVELHQSRIQQSNLSLNSYFSRDLPLIRGDRLLLKQVFFNVMSNAVKFTEAGGKITIIAQPVEEGVSCAITDTGIGMSDEEIHLAMQPFEQIDRRLERQYGGIGLGLALCKGYVDLHGGQMAIKSSPSKGTTVDIILPRHENPAETNI